MCSLTARRGAPLLLLTLLPLVLPVPPARAADSGELLYSTEGNRLRRYDVDTLAGPRIATDVLVERQGDGGEGGGGGATPNGRDINGMICAFPDGSGRFVAGEDTGQPTPPAGWGIFAPDGTQVGKLTATYPDAGPEPYGCAFNSEGILFTTSTGDPGIGFGNGQLLMWFPPYVGFPGPPGAYPETSAASDNVCKLAVDIGTATGIAIDADDNVYVASGGLLRIDRFAPPFPTGLGPGEGCEAIDALTGAPLAESVNRDVAVQGNLASPFSTFTGLALAPNGNLYAASIISGTIGEFRLDAPSPAQADTLVRTLLEPDAEAFPFPSTGTPQGLAVGGDGTLYYADLSLVGVFPNVGPGPDGKVRRIRFDTAGDPLPPETIRDGLAFPDGVAVLPGHLPSREWRTYAGGPARLFHNPDETILTPQNIGGLVQRWRFETDAIITGSPSVAYLALPGEEPQQIAYFQSWDGFVYAVRVKDGSEVWRFETVAQAGANFPNTASAHIGAVNGRETVFIGSGHLFYALDALTGEEIWRFTAGSGCVDENGDPPGDCIIGGERNEIESSTLVADGKVFVGMDVNDSVGGKGGFFALDAADGRMAWFFDLESGQTCRPFAGDEIRQFDAYHDADVLNLPADFSTTRPGCDFPRSVNGCGNVWSTFSYDPGRGVLYVTSSNCDTQTGPGDDPRKPLPPMPPYDEAIFAITTDGTPLWRWRAYPFDNDDFAYGASPNLFQIDLPGHGLVDVLGVGQKDGHYRVLDRDGVNRLNGIDCTATDSAGQIGCVDPAVGGEPGEPADFAGFPYWDTQVVPGGDAGGVILTAAVDEARRRVYFSTAPGFDPTDPQQPTLHYLDMDTGAVAWDSSRFAPGSPEADIATSASFAPTSSIPGLTFFGTVPFELLRVVPNDNDDPQDIHVFPVSPLPLSGAASGPVVVDGVVLLGHGIGVRGNPQDAGTITSNLPSALVALCVPGTAGCAACDDGVDNDGDGEVDGEDSGCSGPADLTERPDCMDAVDNDHDGFADWPADAGCRNQLPRAAEAPACDDGIDNDGDGDVDFAPASGPADAQCNAAWDESEGASSGPVCGLLGLEPLLLLGVARALRRRRLRVSARSLGLAFVLASLTAPGIATAAPIALDVTAALSVRIADTLAFVGPARAGTVTVDPITRELALPAGLLTASGTLAATPAATFSVSNPAATFRPGGAESGTCPGPLGGRGACILGAAQGGGLGGSMPLLGTIRIPSLSAVLAASVLGAAATDSDAGVVFQGAPWTGRTAAVTTTAQSFWTTARGNVPTSWFAGAGLPAETLRLVAPIHVNLAGGARVPVFALLELTAVPEPQGLAILALGFAALAIAIVRGHR